MTTMIFNYNNDDDDYDADDEHWVKVISENLCTHRWCNHEIF